MSRLGGDVNQTLLCHALLTDTTNPMCDWLADVVGNIDLWAVQQGLAVLEGALAVAQVGANALVRLGWASASGYCKRCVQKPAWCAM